MEVRECLNLYELARNDMYISLLSFGITLKAVFFNTLFIVELFNRMRL